MSINDDLPSSNARGKSKLTLLAWVLGIIVVAALYYNTIGY